MWINIKRMFRSGFVSFWRNGIVSLASILALSVTLVVIGSLMLATAYLDASLDSIKDKVDISVSFKIDAPDARSRA